MNEDDKIIGFFTSCEHLYDESEDEKEFVRYLWGKGGLRDKLSTLSYKNYGNDLILILFQYNLFPSDSSLEHITEIERYRPKRKQLAYQS